MQIKKTPNIISYSLTMSSMLLLAGCAASNLPPPPPKSSPATTQLAEAATSVSHSIATLEAISKAETPHYTKKLPNPETYGMPGVASINWTGPLKPIVKRLANSSGFKVKVFGRPPAVPIIVQLHLKNTPIAEILRDVDYQAGQKAFIKVFARRKLVELRYARS